MSSFPKRPKQFLLQKEDRVVVLYSESILFIGFEEPSAAPYHTLYVYFASY